MEGEQEKPQNVLSWTLCLKKMIIRVLKLLPHQANHNYLTNYIDRNNTLPIVSTYWTTPPFPTPHTGHSGSAPIERKIYHALARMKNVQRICEIGFNAGHSASLWLMANPTAEVIMFDLWAHNSSDPGARFLLSPEARALGIQDAASRLRIIKGDSTKTVVDFSAENPSVKCDLLSVDGGHTHDVALADIRHMHNLANPRFNTVVIDDTQCDLPWCVDSALEEHQRRGTLQKLLSVSIAPRLGSRGLTIAAYA